MRGARPLSNSAVRRSPNSCTSSAPKVEMPTSLTQTGNVVCAWISVNFPGHSLSCQWFHFEDHRLDDAVRWLKKLGVKQLRTGLSWADSFRPNANAWFDRLMLALDSFEVTTTFCFTPEHLGLRPHHTSAPRVLTQYAEFCARMVKRYAPGMRMHKSAQELVPHPEQR